MTNKSLNELVVLSESLAHGNLSFEDFTKQISDQPKQIKELLVDYAHSVRLEINLERLYKVTQASWVIPDMKTQRDVSEDILETLKTLIK